MYRLTLKLPLEILEPICKYLNNKHHLLCDSFRSKSNSKNSTALVGYAAIDGDSTWIDPLANYLSCDPSNTNSGSTSIDLYGLNN